MMTDSAGKISGENVTIVIVDAMPLRRASIAGLLSTWFKSLDIHLCAMPPNMGAAEKEMLKECRLAMLSLGMISLEESQGQSWFATLSTNAPVVPLAIISDREDRREIASAFAAGVKGFLPTSLEPALAAQAVRFILNGGTFFPPMVLLAGYNTDRETLPTRPRVRELGTTRSRCERVVFTEHQQQVLHLLCEGRSNKLIARDLTMRESSVKVHVRQIMHKLGASNRTQVALSAMRQQLP